MSKLTLIDHFYEKEQNFSHVPFLRQPFGDQWEVYTWGQVGQMARKLATGLQSLGLAPKSHIGLVSKNCREWVIADLAILMAGYVSVPFYATLSGDQLAEVIKLGDVKALFVGKMEVWEDMKTGVPEGMPMIAFPHYEGNSEITEARQWNEFMENFEPLAGNPAPDIDDIWTIVFTSGTTGTPKGVVLTFRTLYEAGSIIETYNPLHVSQEGDNHFFSFLPLNHIAERVIVENGVIAYGGQISFTESLAMFAKNLSEAQPTVFFAVPRIWTKLQLGILSKMSQAKLNLLLSIPIISGIIKKKIKEGLGFSACRAFVSGAAPITESLKNWFRKLDIPISEGYGMTENCAICTFLTAEEDKPGSVGKPQPGVRLKIDGDTGEVLMKAPYNMREYYKSPKKTAEVLKDGWLHTGDQGRIDEEGYLFLTGRVKDTFKTAKGKYIIPAPIEWRFEDNNDIEQICLLGLGLPQPMALIVPSELGLAKSEDELKTSLGDTLKKVNMDLPNYRKVSTIVIVKEAFSIENGLLTPTLKIKRNVMNKRYQDYLMSWHEHESEVVFE